MMEKITWSPEFSVGIAELDKHHQKMFELYNNVVGAINNNLVDSKLIGESLEALADYIEYHFKAEEKCLEQCGYPAEELEAHREMHLKFSTDTLRLMREHMQKDVGLLDHLVDHISNWLVNHIMREDKRYYHYFSYMQMDMHKMNCKLDK